MKIINQIDHESGMRIEISVTIVKGELHWYYSERLQFHDGESDSLVQTFAEFHENGPPPFAARLHAEKLSLVRSAVEILLRCVNFTPS